MLGDEARTMDGGEVESGETVPAAPSLWRRFKRLFARDERLYHLNWAISAYPNEPANYVLRGELLLKMGDAVGAAADFRQALELAAAQVETQDWGIAAQVMQDRALAGLRDALLRVARYNRPTAQDSNLT